MLLYAWLSGVLSEPIEIAVGKSPESEAMLRAAFDLGWRQGALATTTLVAGGLLISSGIMGLVATRNKVQQLLARVAEEES